MKQGGELYSPNAMGVWAVECDGARGGLTGSPAMLVLQLDHSSDLIAMLQPSPG
jgi:hypothetical protein